MKKILITGASSYIGNSFIQYIEQLESKDLIIDKISVRNKEWEKHDFTGYDTVLHLAAIVHKRESKENKELYFKVNRDLAVNVARKAKNSGVGQFIFMSTAAVYGSKVSVIKKDTAPNPDTYYGKSKLEAESEIAKLASDGFKVAIVRPPMVYGEGCKGNYERLVKLAKITPVFPDIQNKRSMIHIDNLCEFLNMLIIQEKSGYFHPQDEEYVCTSQMMKRIGEKLGRKIYFTKAFNWCINLLKNRIGIVNKIFGNWYYELDEVPTVKKALMMAHVASMIDLFNMDNIHLLQEMGYEVHVACNFEHGSVTSKHRVNEFKMELINQGIKVFHIPVPRSASAVGNIIESYHTLRNLVDANHYDIVHCQSPIGGVIARLACKKARKQGTRVIYVAHGFHFYKGASVKNWLLYYPIEKYSSKYTDCLITMNQEDYNLALKKMKKAKQIQYIPGVGIDVQGINNIEVDRVSKRKELGIPIDSTVVVSVGELNKNKNHEVIIRALARIKSPKIHYIICGKGPLKDYLIKLSEELGINKNVHILGYRKDVIEVLKVSDIFAFPSSREGLSVSLMEAMAAGLPVVCSKIRGNTDLIRDGEGGYVVSKMNIEGYFKALNKILNDKDIIVKMGNGNILTINKYDEKKVNRIMEKIYMNI